MATYINFHGMPQCRNCY